jgi:hypothetical protein
MTRINYEYLRQYATVRQHEILDVLSKAATQEDAARMLGMRTDSLQEHITRLKKKASMQGVSPEHDMNHAVPEGYIVKGVSTYYSEDGTVRGQWVKSALNQNQQQIQQAFLEAFKEDIPKMLPTKFKNKENLEEALLNVYVYGDPHIGLRTWEDETGTNHDLNSSINLFTTAHADLVHRSPNAETAIILNLGDYFHADDGRNVTLRSGHVLDVDGRYQKVRIVGFKILRAMIEMALEKHKKVIVWNIQGNHDDYSAIDLSLWLSVAYEDEPRVHIETSPNRFYYYQHGYVMLAATHGDTVRQNKIQGVMSADKSEMWGQTRFRYAHMGHIHHKTLKDEAGVAVETHRVLQPNDLYSHMAGYRSQRDAQCITYHSRLGEYARVMVNPIIVEGFVPHG